MLMEEQLLLSVLCFKETYHAVCVFVPSLESASTPLHGSSESSWRLLKHVLVAWRAVLFAVCLLVFNLLLCRVHFLYFAGVCITTLTLWALYTTTLWPQIGERIHFCIFITDIFYTGDHSGSIKSNIVCSQRTVLQSYR